MAQLQSYAEVVGSEEVSGPLQETGRSPGRPLREYVELSKGTYIYDMPVPSVDRERLHSVATLTGDEGLHRIASAGRIPISLDHLRGCAAETLVRIGYTIMYSPEEVDRLGFDDPDVRA